MNEICFMGKFCGILLLTTVVSWQAYAQSRLPVDAFDVSNQILKSGCEIEVQLQAMRWHIRESAEAGSIHPPNYIAGGKFKLNGKSLPAPYGLLQMLSDASRVIEPPQQVLCGFVVVTGDASLTGRTLVRIEHGRITSAEHMDTDGRLFAKTLFFYPKAVTLN
jgi:hypothetical protein